MATKVGNLKGPQGDPGRDGDGVGAHLTTTVMGTPYSATQGGPVQFPNDANTGKGTIVAGVDAIAEVVLATWDASAVIEAGHAYTVTFDFPMRALTATDVPASLVPIIRAYNMNLNPLPGGGSAYLPVVTRPDDAHHIGDYIDYRWVMTGYAAVAPTKLWDVRLMYYAWGTALPDITYQISSLNVQVVDLGEYTP